MNISYSWLKDYIDFSLTPEELSAALTSIGLECGGIERVESIRGGLRGLVIGRVLTCEDHPDSDHLHITTVDLGDGRVEQIVCGAPNVAAGQNVVVATVGTTLYDGDKEFQIKKSKIRGVQSMGMICAEDEIGVGTSHDGIIVIPDDKAPAPGTPAAEYYQLSDDFVLEVDLTPNRIDAASHFGVARDLGAWTSVHSTPAKAVRPSVDNFKVDDPAGKGVEVAVEDAEGCIRYSGLTIEGVKVTESPDWLKARLSEIGLRPINNIVDITNYILHGMGQPLHCFDRAKIAGDKIVVRTVADETKFTTLDGVERKLDSRDLMICNADEPMCIAGVFGGLDSGVTETTTDVFIESACFNPTRVRKTARRHGLNTDSSFRFERGVDPNSTMYNLKLAALMIQQLAGGRIVGEPVDFYPTVVEPFKVELSTEYMTRLIGQEIPEKTVDTILDALEIETVSHEGDTRHLLVPTYRVDVQRPCDVVEDVLRIYGYNNIEVPDAVHSTLSYKTKTDAVDDLRRTISEQLTAAGFHEILNNSLTAERYYAGLTELSAEGCVKLLNPLSQDLNVMRRTLLFGGLESLAHNINRRAKDLAFYEFGNVYSMNPEQKPTDERPLGPFSEGSRLALWMTGDTRSTNWARQAEAATFYDLKAAVLNIIARLGISTAELTFTPDNSLELFGAAIVIATRNGKRLGSMGILDPKIAASFDIKQPVFFAELDWDAVSALALKKQTVFSELPKTQAVKRDLALLVDADVTMARIEEIVRSSERKILRDVTLFDVYEGDKLPAGKKSYAISILLQDNEKTLQDKYIDQVMNKIINNLTRQLGAELR
ncbi:MAG: phenylalanine--tRNA ligase subunit beta [Bacteroidales bacterium]|nr:phenylalanine--tRNA ligase subunit beta [Bacteroidales bacterium]